MVGARLCTGVTLLVPYDGSALSKTALSRAQTFAEFTDEDLLALVVIPDEPGYAHRHDWLDPADTFDVGVVERKLTQEIRDVAPDAEVRAEFVENTEPTADTTMIVVRTIKEVAAELAVSVVFVGSQNAGKVTRPLASIGGTVADDARYDVHIVRHPDPEFADE
nr:universal stress protein [Halorubellus sp. JP-L1]